MAKMKKNERKRDLLINNDINGIRKLIQQYRNERFWLKLENHHHRYKCGNVGDKAKHWRLLADALNKEDPCPSLGLPDLSEAEKRGKDAEEQATLQNQLIDYEAQWKATQLIASNESHDIFSIDRSRAKLKGLQSMRDSRGREVNQKRLAQATKKHEHRINALINGNAEDAAALADIYQREFDKHVQALREKSVKEERVQARGIAWWRKLRELQRQAGQDAQHR